MQRLQCKINKDLFAKVREKQHSAIENGSCNDYCQEAKTMILILFALSFTRLRNRNANSRINAIFFVLHFPTNLKVQGDRVLHMSKNTTTTHRVCVSLRAFIIHIASKPAKKSFHIRISLFLCRTFNAQIVTSFL